MDQQKILGESSLLTQALEQLSIVAPLNKPVLILGERGTGKELVAERLHYLSTRWDKPYLKVNCAALSESLLESTLFGHEVGAFTGATKSKKGLFERADLGTLFLDELATISSRVQEKLLRVIEYGEFERLGGQQPVQTDVRLIAATNEHLVKMAERGEFRADLLDRLAFDVINLPPLRLRAEDILILAEHFAIAMCIELGRDVFMGFSQQAIHVIQSYAWPGNVRELKNAIQRSVYRQQEALLPLEEVILDPFKAPWHAADQEQQTTPAPTPTPTEKNETKVIEKHLPSNFKQHVTDFEMSVLKTALEKHYYHQQNTAKAIGLTYHQLRAYLKKYPQLLIR